MPPIPDVAGNEPLFARLIFESLATRYAERSGSSGKNAGPQTQSAYTILGGGSRNKLLTELTAQRTGLPVACGHPESSTIGNFAVQLAASQARGKPLSHESIRRWAETLCNNSSIDQENAS